MPAAQLPAKLRRRDATQAAVKSSTVFAPRERELTQALAQKKPGYALKEAEVEGLSRHSKREKARR